MDSLIETKYGELYKLTFPENNSIEDSFRFFSQDVGSQTEESDIVNLFELTAALSQLIIDNANLKRKLNLTRSTLQSEFHRRLSNASNDLYCRMNEKLDDMERSQKDRVEVVRRAFRTQLTDALSHMASLYNEKLRKKLKNERTFLESEESVKLNKKIADLTYKLKKSEAKVKELTKQITDYQELAEEPTIILESDSEIDDKVNLDLEEDNHEKELLSDENLRQKDLINELNQRIEELEHQNQYHQKTIENLNSNIKNVSDELQNKSQIVEVLKSEKQLIQTKLEKMEEKIDKKEKELEILHDSMVKSKSPIPEPVKEKPVTVAFEVQKNLKEYPDMTKEINELKDHLQKLQNKESDHSKEFLQLKNALMTESKNYIDEIKTLKMINIKLKEEMFRRKEIQNNFKALHSASVSYARNKRPIGILPNQYIEESLTKNQTSDNMLTFENKSHLSEKDQELLKNFVELKI